MRGGGGGGRGYAPTRGWRDQQETNLVLCARDCFTLLYNNSTPQAVAWIRIIAAQLPHHLSTCYEWFFRFNTCTLIALVTKQGLY